MTIIYCKVPEISSAMDRFFCHFGPEFIILEKILPFYPLKNPKNQNFEKMKKIPGDTIILQKCTKNHDHMVYCSWDMAHDGSNYFSFWAIFCPLTCPKSENLKEVKKAPWDIIILHKCT